eukprot:TRINITY_DN3249_c0_g1_i1.p1 TRINITY_DN3249_c0_g1~~TRINITY_DN3249_c0_g1_i1.p1  ORF type:complete len:192 (+),score=24.65 TRINITY_DN3249_c0_g1_i1:73-648(+)
MTPMCNSKEETHHFYTEGCNLREKNEANNTVLHFACLFNKLEVIRYLVDGKGCSLDDFNKLNNSPYMLAFMRNPNLDVTKYLYEDRKESMNFGNREYAPIQLSLGNENPEILKYFMDKMKGFEKYMMIFLKSALEKSCKKETLKYLMSFENINTSIMDHQGKNAIDWAIRGKCGLDLIRKKSSSLSFNIVQ